MTQFARVALEALTLSDLAHNLVADASRSLMNVAGEQSKSLPLQEILRRFDAAAKELRGDKEISAGVSKDTRQVGMGGGYVTSMCVLPNLNREAN